MSSEFTVNGTLVRIAGPLKGSPFKAGSGTAGEIVRSAFQITD